MISSSRSKMMLFGVLVVKSWSLQKLQVADECGCIHLPNVPFLTAERIDLKKALSKTFGNIQSSKLSSFIQSKKKRGKIEALLVPKDNIRFSLKEGERIYLFIYLKPPLI